MTQKDDRKQLAIELYRTGQSIYDIAPQIGVQYQTIHKWLVKSGEPRRSKSEAGKLAVERKGKWQQRYTYNHSAFREIDTPEQAYWLGFLAADGTIGDNGVVQISLAIKDIGQLEKWKLFVKTDAPIRYGHTSDNLGERDYCRINCCSAEIWSDLIRHGVAQRKTATVSWPHWLSTHLQRAYLLGYFDGDGGFCNDKGAHPDAQWSIAGNPSFLLDAQAFMMTALSVKKTKLIKRSGTEVVRSLCYGGNCQVSRIALWMYRSAPIRMERKVKSLLDVLTINNFLSERYVETIRELRLLINYSRQFSE